MRVKKLAIILNVKDQKKTIPLFHKAFGGKVGGAFPEGDHWNMPFVIANTLFEVMQPKDPDGAVAKFINEKGEGLSSIALMVDNLDEAIAELEKEGYKIARRHRFEPPITTIDGTEWVEIATPDPAQTFGIRFLVSETRP